MKKILSYIAFGAAAIVSASCSVNQMTPQVSSDTRVQMEFTAGTVDTKTSINGLEVLWSAGDAISVFDGTDNNKFDLTGGEDTKSATFSGKANEVSEYVALYPYSANASFADNTITATLPVEQYSTVDNSFDTMLNPAVAKSSDNTLTFRNIAGLIRINVTNVPEGLGIREIQAKAATSLTGEYTVNTSGDDFEAVASGSEVNGVRLVAKDGGELAEGAYNLVVLPGEYDNFKVTVILTDGSYIAKGGENAPVATIPANGGIDITIDASNLEPVSRDLYDLFNDGVDIYIAGKVYNKSQYEEAEIRHFTTANSSIFNTSETNGDGKIFFIDIKDQDKPLSIGNAGDIVVIGVDPDNKPQVIRSGANLASSQTGKSRLVLHNLNIDMPNSQNNQGSAINFGFNANSAFGELTLSNCDITMRDAYALIQINTAGTTIDELNIIDCNINIPAGTSNRYILKVGTNSHTISSLNISNNILHCDDGIAGTFRFINSNSTSCQLVINKLDINNNTLVNLANTNTSAGIVKDIDNVTVTKNLIYFNQSIDSYNSGTSYPNFLRPTGKYPEIANCYDNISYQLPTDEYQRTFRVFQDNNYTPTVGQVENAFRKIDVDPFESGDFATFKPSPEYASYGAQR